MSEITVTKLGLGQTNLGQHQLGSPQFEVSESAPIKQGPPYLVPNEGDFASENGVILGGTSARQIMIVLLMTKFGSSQHVRGTKFADYHDEASEQVNKAEVRRVLQPMVTGERPLIRLDDIRVVREHDRVVGRLGIFIDFFDYRRNQPDTLEI